MSEGFPLGCGAQFERHDAAEVIGAE